jgi:hypothetical protein
MQREGDVPFATRPCRIWDFVLIAGLDRAAVISRRANAASRIAASMSGRSTPSGFSDSLGE